METRNLPGTELDLSVVGFGAWAIGGDYWGDDVTDERSIGAVHKALDVGINWFDTAPLYGHGHSEEVLVRAVEAPPPAIGSSTPTTRIRAATATSGYA